MPRSFLNILLFYVVSFSVPGLAIPDRYLDDVQPVLSKRCVACHGCYEAPCQLNLQSYAGLRRGFNPIPIYSGKRIAYTAPTRLEDGKTIQDWRNQGFLPVVAHDSELDKDSQSASFREGLLFKLLAQGAQNEPKNGFSGFPLEDVQELQKQYDADKRQCLATANQMRAHFSVKNPNKVLSLDEYLEKYRFAGMPFGLPRLEKTEQDVLDRWLEDGAPGPSLEAQALLEASAHPEVIEKWETFLNTDSAKGQLSARYIYEHVFSATLHFDEAPGEYYELVRSRTQKGEISQIVTQVPIDDPGVKRVYYRLKKVTRTLAQKTQNVWRLNFEKLKHLDEMFLKADWGTNAIPYPSYSSNNMFEYSSAIPAKIRSRFVMENSKLIVGAMVQGTVCIGSGATYAIADHFWAWFLNPDVDPSVLNPSLGLDSIAKLGTAPQPWVPKTKTGEKLLALTEKLDLRRKDLATRVARDFRLFHKFTHGEDGSDSHLAELIMELREQELPTAEILGTIYHLFKSVEGNKAYQKAFEHELRLTLRSQGKTGLTLNDLWAGDKDPVYPKGNPNAWLSITRHGKSATVQFGPEGGSPQSIWVMSYSNFERLYYNLVVHFKVWGSLPHKMATWRHMSYVRLEGEDLAISLLPIEHRLQVRDWFSHGLGGKFTAIRYPLQSIEEMWDGWKRLAARPDAEPSLHGATAEETVHKFVSVLRKRFKDVATAGEVGVNLVTPAQAEWEWKKGILALQNKSEKQDQEPFAQFLPEITYVRVHGSNNESWVYTLLANRGYKSHTIVIAQNPEREPETDTMSLYRGFVGAYPGVFMDVDAENRDRFAQDLLGIRSERDWEKVRAYYGVSRNSAELWKAFDWFQNWKKAAHPGVDPVEQGVSDLSQYQFFY